MSLKLLFDNYNSMDKFKQEFFQFCLLADILTFCRRCSLIVCFEVELFVLRCVEEAVAS